MAEGEEDGGETERSRGSDEKGYADGEREDRS